MYEALKPILNEMSQRFDSRITTELMKMNQTLTEEIINNRESIYDTAELKCGGTWGWRRAVYLDMTDSNTNATVLLAGI